MLEMYNSIINSLECSFIVVAYMTNGCAAESTRIGMKDEIITVEGMNVHVRSGSRKRISIEKLTDKLSSNPIKVNLIKTVLM